MRQLKVGDRVISTTKTHRTGESGVIILIYDQRRKVAGPLEINKWGRKKSKRPMIVKLFRMAQVRVDTSADGTPMTPYTRTFNLANLTLL